MVLMILVAPIPLQHIPSPLFHLSSLFPDISGNAKAFCPFLQGRGALLLSAAMETTNETRQQAQQQQEEAMQIEGLRSDYCDDFVCTSSPAVEQTVRSLARDLVRQKWTPSLFTRDVVYQVSPRMHA